MSDNSAGTNAPGLPAVRSRVPFPALRLVYSFLFAIIAWFVFWISLLVALIQFIVVTVDGRASEDLRRMSANLMQYLGDLLAYIAFVRDDPPFPIGAFPKY